ncbi:MAG: hypothetical protein QOE35_4088 [Actinomycetota bacterium]|jgi:Tol biopolymer transport system component
MLSVLVAAEVPVDATALGLNGLIAFASDRTGIDQIFVMQPDGSGQHAVAPSSGYADNYPSWSPDGTQIAFVRCCVSAPGNTDLFVMNADGTGQVILSNSMEADYFPKWSPDGSKILFWRATDAYDGSVFLMDASGANETRVTNGYAPAWSPSGDRIAFSRSNGMRVRYLASGQEVFTGVGGVHPSWSPDGGLIAYNCCGSEVGVAESNLTSSTVLTDEGIFTGYPTWSPDGQQIAVTMNVPYATAIGVMDADGTAVMNASSPIGYNDRQPDWLALSPPGQPSWLTAEPVSATSIHLEWGLGPPDDNATGYKVLRSEAPNSGGPYTEVGTTVARNFDDNTVTGDHWYFYAIQATSPGGVSASSGEASVNLRRVPNLRLVSRSGTAVSLAWDELAGIGFYGPHAVERSTEQSGPWTSLGWGSVSALPFIDNVPASDAAYYYRVRASGQFISLWSETLTVAAPPAAPPTPIAVAGSRAATVAFAAPPSDGGTPIASYTVTASPGGQTVSGTGSPMTLTGLVNGDAYSFTVHATNAVGDGPESPASNVVTPGPELTISDASLTEGNGGTRTLTFTVRLATRRPSQVTVRFSTTDGTANHGVDYKATEGSVVFKPRSTRQTISVTIYGDRSAEANETFFVNLSSPVGGTIADAQAVGTIVDND